MERKVILGEAGNERVVFYEGPAWENNEKLILLDQTGFKKFYYCEEDGCGRICFPDGSGKEVEICFEDFPEKNGKFPKRLKLIIAVSLIVLSAVMFFAGFMIRPIFKSKPKNNEPAKSQIETQAPVDPQPEVQAPTEAPAESQPEAKEPAEVPSESQPETKTPAETQPEEPKEVFTGPVLTAYYDGNMCNIPVNTADSKNSCIEEPYVLPYDGNGVKRDVSFTFTERIKSITQVNRNFDSIGKLSFSYLDDKDITAFEFKMEVPENDPTRDYRYFFKVTTLDDKSYYFGIRYVHPDLL